MFSHLISFCECIIDIGQIKPEPGNQKEFEGLVHSGQARLKDSHVETLSLESRFDLAYNAAHALSLAALRWHGYRSENRFIVFQCLQHTIGVGSGVWRILALCHDRRNIVNHDSDWAQRMIFRNSRFKRNITEYGLLLKIIAVHNVFS